MNAIAALLFDLDGTLIDSMGLHEAAWRRLHEAEGWPFAAEEFLRASAGRSSDEIFRELFGIPDPDERARLGERKEAIYRELAEPALRLVAGAEACIAQARALGLSLAICTAAPLANLALADRLFSLSPKFDLVVTPADGVRGKPHPDIFLRAAERLGVAAVSCLVFEDALLGVEAAQRANMQAVVLTTSVPASAFASFSNVRACAADFQALDLATLLG